MKYLESLKAMFPNKGEHLIFTSKENIETISKEINVFIEENTILTFKMKPEKGYLSSEKVQLSIYTHGSTFVFCDIEDLEEFSQSKNK